MERSEPSLLDLADPLRGRCNSSFLTHPVLCDLGWPYSFLSRGLDPLCLLGLDPRLELGLRLPLSPLLDLLELAELREESLDADRLRLLSEYSGFRLPPGDREKTLRPPGDLLSPFFGTLFLSFGDC